MGHNIKAIVLKGCYSTEGIEKYDLQPIKLDYDGITMFHISDEYSAYWQYKLGLNKHIEMENVKHCYLPSEFSIPYIACELALENPASYAIIETDYFGGMGYQSALYFNGESTDGKIIRINEALKLLGVEAKAKLDEFDTIGLSNHRSTPDYLSKYYDFVEKLEL